MDPEIGPLETTRTKGLGLSLRLGLALGLLLVATATAKPWALLAPRSTASPSASALSATAEARPTSATSASPTASAGIAREDPICPNSDGWRIVIDDVEFGKAVRTWLVPTAFYASAEQPPMLAQRDVIRFVSAGVRQLAFCAPPGADGQPPVMWSGELWFLPDIADPTSKRLVGSLASAPDAFSAVVRLAGNVVAWPAGLYLLEARVYPATAPLWVPVELDYPRPA